MTTKGAKLYQDAHQPKTRWSGFLTTENFDWLSRVAISEDRSVANVLNRVIREYRKNGNGDTTK